MLFGCTYIIVFCILCFIMYLYLYLLHMCLDGANSFGSWMCYCVACSFLVLWLVEEALFDFGIFENAHSVAVASH